MQRISLAVGGARRGRGGVTAARWGGVGVWSESSGAGEDHGEAVVIVLSLLLRVQLPLAAAHGRDEGGALAAAVLGQQEVDVAFRGELLHRLLENLGEAEGGE